MVAAPYSNVRKVNVVDEDDLIAEEYDDDNDKGSITKQSVDKADCDDCNGLSSDLKSLDVSADL